MDVFQIAQVLHTASVDDLVERIGEAELAKLPLYVLQRALSGNNDPQQLVNLARLSNPYLFTLRDHPQLLLKLMKAATTNSGGYKYPTQRTQKKATLAIKAVAEFYEITEADAVHYLETLTPKEVSDCAEALGWDTQQLKKLAVESKG